MPVWPRAKNLAPSCLAPSHMPRQCKVEHYSRLTSLYSPHYHCLVCGRSLCTWLHQQMASPLSSSASQPWKKTIVPWARRHLWTSSQGKIQHVETSSLVDAIKASTEDCAKLIFISSTTHFAREMGLRVVFLENRSRRVTYTPFFWTEAGSY